MLPEQISEHTEKMITHPLSPSTARTGHMTQTNLEASREGSSGKFTSSSAKVTPCQSTVVPLPLASPGNSSLTNSVFLRCNSHTMKFTLLVTSPWLAASLQGPATTSTIYIRLELCHPPKRKPCPYQQSLPNPLPARAAKTPLSGSGFFIQMKAYKTPCTFSDCSQLPNKENVKSCFCPSRGDYTRTTKSMLPPPRERRSLYPPWGGVLSSSSQVTFPP